MRELLVVLDKVDRVVPLVAEGSRLGVVRPGSPLAAEDLRTQPHRISARAWTALTESVEFLRAARGVCADGGDLRVVRALVRGAVENACCGVWLLGASRAERLADAASEVAVERSALVRRAGELAPAVGAELAVAAWRACDGLSPAVDGVLVRAEVVDQVQPGIDLASVAESVRPVLAAAAVGLMVLGRGLELFKARSRVVLPGVS
ncbi:hypothetical protein [Saccharothrix coeruleofusca]|nr:hypothetical protein [Saccharothrix coeruleofusca]MBP2336317.1 hypothetical protein [Saccharothrix coeruleofusca]